MLTEIVFVLDETGSMGSIKEDTIGSFNNFIEEQKQEEGDAVLTLTKFSKTSEEETYRIAYQEEPLENVDPLDEYTYRPRGFTPLLDAIGCTIDKVDSKADLTIMVVLTDGLENASVEYTLSQVRDKVEAKKTDGWEFMFLGANMDAVKVGGSMGIDTTHNFDATREGTRSAFAMASQTVSYARRKSR